MGDQVRGAVMRTLAVGDPDRGQASLRGGRSTKTIGTPRSSSGCRNCVVPTARHDHQRVHAAGEQPVDQVLLAIRVGIRADREDQAALLRSPPARPTRLSTDGERIADVLEHQSDGGGPAVGAAQRVRGVVAPVAELRAARSTRSRVSGEAPTSSLITRDTDFRLTPAARATSFMVGRRSLSAIARSLPVVSVAPPAPTGEGATVGAGARYVGGRMSSSGRAVSVTVRRRAAGRATCRARRARGARSASGASTGAGEQSAPCNPRRRRPRRCRRGAGGRAGAPSGTVPAAAGPLVDGPARRPVRRVRPDQVADWSSGSSGWPRSPSATATPSCAAGHAAHARPGLVPGRGHARLRRVHRAVRRRAAGSPTKIDYLRELGVSYLHLMPLLQPREGDSDGGYAVADYRSVRSRSRNIDDLRKLAAELRAHRASAW